MSDWAGLSLVVNMLLIAWILGGRRGRKLAQPIEDLSQRIRESTAYWRGWLAAKKETP